MKHESRCKEGCCLLNPLGLAIECLNCALHKETDEAAQDAFYVIQPEEDGTVPCPYYGGECLVMSGTGAIGEWCIDCAHTDPEHVFKPQERKHKGKERRIWNHGRYCESCGAFFYAEQEHQRFCSVKCRKREKMRRYFKRKKEQKIAMRQANGQR